MLPKDAIREHWFVVVDQAMSGCQNWPPAVRIVKYQELRYLYGLYGFPDEAKQKIEGLLQDPLPGYVLQPLASAQQYTMVPCQTDTQVDLVTVARSEAADRVTLVHRFDVTVRPFGFFECPKVMPLAPAQQTQLLQLVVLNGTAYAVAMVVGVLEFDKQTRRYQPRLSDGTACSWSKTWFHQLLARALPSATERAVKGNCNLLRCAASREDTTLYRVRDYLPQAERDYGAFGLRPAAGSREPSAGSR